MFNNIFKNLKDLKEINNLISSESVEVEKEGIKVKVNGKMEIEEIVLNPSLDIKKQQIVLKNCLNEALNKIRMNLVSVLSSKKFNI